VALYTQCVASSECRWRYTHTEWPVQSNVTFTLVALYTHCVASSESRWRYTHTVWLVQSAGGAIHTVWPVQSAVTFRLVALYTHSLCCEVTKFYLFISPHSVQNIPALHNLSLSYQFSDNLICFCY